MHAAAAAVGTPYYMSPERIHEVGYNFKSDIWSLGCLLYEMAELQSPFYAQGMTLFMLCCKIKKGDYPPLAADVYTEELRSLVEMCIRSNAVDRPEVTYVQDVSQTMYNRYFGLPVPS